MHIYLLMQINKKKKGVFIFYQSILLNMNNNIKTNLFIF